MSATPAAAPAVSVQERATQLVDHLKKVEGYEVFAAEEAKVAAVRDGILAPWAASFKAGDAAAFAALFADGAKGVSFPTTTTAGTVRDGIVETTWSADAAPVSADAAAAYLAGFASIQDVRLRVTTIVSDDAGHDVELSYDLRGVAADGARRHDRGTFSARVESGKLASLSATAVDSLHATVGRVPSFDAVADAGLVGLHEQTRSEAIRRGGYALATADYDNDKAVDVLVGHAGPVQLFRNVDGTFVDVTEAAGLRGEKLVKSAAFADLDNDGHRDLVLLRFVDGDKDAGGDFVAYRNKGDGTFEHKGDVLTRMHDYDRSMPLTMADFDGDGRLDLYVGFPGSRDFTNNLGSGDRADSVSSQGVWLNKGDWNFTELTASTEAGDLTEHRYVYPHAALANDLNGDGKPDLIVVDDSGRTNPVYFNTGSEFRDATKDSGLAHAGWGMGASVADFDGDGRLDVYMTNIDLPEANRLLASFEGREAGSGLEWGLTNLKHRLKGNALFRSTADGTFEKVEGAAGLANAGSAPAVATWLDYNEDGHMDVYVPNGLWSGGAEEFEPYFVAAMALPVDRRFDPKPSTEYTALMTEDSVFNAPIFAKPGDADPNPVLTMLREYKGTLANTAAGEVSTKPTLTFAGYERNTLFRNNGDGTFTEVGFLEGADRIEDGYVAAALDLDRDGRQDLVLRNCDPAPGVNYETVVMLRNQREAGHTLVVDVHGTPSNADAVGTTVRAWVGGRQLVRTIDGVAGAVQHEPTVFLGLGDATKVERLEIRFPSGQVRTFTDVAEGRILITEDKEGYQLAMR